MKRLSGPMQRRQEEKKADSGMPPPWVIDRINRRQRKRRPLREQPMVEIPVPLQKPPKEDKPKRGVEIIEPETVDFTIIQI